MNVGRRPKRAERREECFGLRRSTAGWVGKARAALARLCILAAPLALWFMACLAWGFGPGGKRALAPYAALALIAFGAVVGMTQLAEGLNNAFSIISSKLIADL